MITGWARIAVVGTIFAFFFVVFLGLGLGSSLSRNLNPGRGEQCENLATTSDPQATVLEPQNTWSNLGYLIAGMLVLYRSRNLFGAMVGFNLAFEFLFSSLYHAKLNETTQTIDVAWIYVLLLSLIAYGIQSLLFSEWAVGTGYFGFTAPVMIALAIEVVVVVLGILMGIYKNEIFESTVTTVVLVGLVFILYAPIGISASVVKLFKAVAKNNMSPNYNDIFMAIAMPLLLFIAIGLPTLFFKFSDGPEHKMFNWCCPKAVLQAHAGWHILSALMVLVAYDQFAKFGKDGSIFSVSN
jgi:hypothetical protein